MAHEVENMFSVAEVPWHGLGNVIKDAPNMEQVLELAGLNWRVGMQPLFLGNGSQVEQNAIVRESDNTVLGFAKNRYQPIQNADILEFFRPFHDSGAAKFETAGSLRSGQKVWIMAALNSAEIEITKNDTVRKYLMLSNGHDGFTSAKVCFTPIRVVCANTLAMAHNDANTKTVRVFHSKNADATLKAVQNIINTANASFEATAEQYRQLAKKQVSKKDIERYVDLVFYNGAQAESDREKLARETLNNEITRLFETGYGNDTLENRGTVWSLYNGVTQYLSYEAGRTQDTRLDSLWFGASKGTNEKALEYALELATA